VLGLGGYDTMYWTFAAALVVIEAAVFMTDAAPRTEPDAG